MNRISGLRSGAYNRLTPARSFLRQSHAVSAAYPPRHLRNMPKKATRLFAHLGSDHAKRPHLLVDIQVRKLLPAPCRIHRRILVGKSHLGLTWLHPRDQPSQRDPHCLACLVLLVTQSRPCLPLLRPHSPSLSVSFLQQHLRLVAHGRRPHRRKPRSRRPKPDNRCLRRQKDDNQHPAPGSR